MSATVFSQANFVFHGHISYKAELNLFQVLIGLNGHVTLAKTASLVSQETEISNISDIYHFNNRDPSSGISHNQFAVNIIT